MRDSLKQWSDGLVRMYATVGLGWMPDAVRATRSVLRDGATDEELDALESRLGTTLPPSYRQFLSLTNGAFGAGGPQMRYESEEPVSLLSTDSVDWTRRYNLRWATILVESADHELDSTGRGPADRTELNDGPHDEAAYLSTPNYEFKAGQGVHTLTIGDWGQEGLLVLNPLVADAAGEWEVLELHGDSRRFSSFRAWLEADFRNVAEHAPADKLPSVLPPPDELPSPPSPDPADTLDPEQIEEIDPIIALLGGMWADALATRSTVDQLLDAGRVADAAAVVAQSAGMESLDVIDLLARHDEPAVWQALESLTTGPEPMRFTALIAASTTSAPFVPALAAQDVLGSSFFDTISRLALEMQNTDAAADQLFSFVNDGNLWAIRALARRRDSRVLLPGLRLLGSTDPNEKLAGAEVLRDLRHEDSTGPLIDAVQSATNPEVTIVAAHALAMMHVVTAIPALRDIRGLRSEEAESLVRRWLSQLEAL